jgi:dsDNA-specific endonuclease/ATPase MutS2
MFNKGKTQMKKTISEKAIDAINESNKSALVMARQMKSGELDKDLGDKAYSSAQRKFKTWRNAYFSRTDAENHLRERREFDRSTLEKELDTASERYGKVLRHYAKAVGVEFQEN